MRPSFRLRQITSLTPTGSTASAFRRRKLRTRRISLPPCELPNCAWPSPFAVADSDSFASSRTGRKGPFCLYYIHIQPGGRSILAAGKWQADGPELLLFRQAILADPKPFRKILAEKEFVDVFGEPKHKGAGKRSSVFGHDDE